MRQVELEESEYAAILLALGYAAGWAKDPDLGNTFLWAANAFNRGNPNWDIYELPEGLEPKEVIRRFMETLRT